MLPPIQENSEFLKDVSRRTAGSRLARKGVRGFAKVVWMRGFFARERGSNKLLRMARREARPTDPSLRKYRCTMGAIFEVQQEIPVQCDTSKPL